MTTPALHDFLTRTSALRALARELVGDSLADDVVQEAALQTMTAPPHGAGPTGGWLRTVVRRVAFKQRRAERIRKDHEAGAAQPDAAPDERSAEDLEVLRRLTDAVESLSEPYRETILARYLREQTPSEIAATTGVPVATVKTRLSRGLTMLRARLDERDADWRAGLALVFALDSDPTAEAPTLGPTTMKLILAFAVLFPVGFATFDGFHSPTAPRGLSSTVPTEEVERTSVANAKDNSGGETAPANSNAPGAATLAAVKPLVRFSVAGPKTFRTAFANTNIGRLLSSAPGEQLWRPLLAPIDAMWRQFDGNRKEFDKTRERVLDYGGRMRVLWMVEPGLGEARDRGFGVVAMNPDGRTDLKALGGDFGRLLVANAKAQAKAKQVGQHALKVIGDQNGFVTLPMVIGSTLVSFFGDQSALDVSVPACLGALAADNQKDTAPLVVDVDLSQVRKLWAARNDKPVVDILGMNTLRSLHAALRPDGVHARLDVEVAFDSGARGILEAFLPDVGRLPDLLARLPIEATPWMTLPLRPSALIRTAIAAQAAYDEETAVDVRAEWLKRHGLHLDTEWLDHLTGEVMIFGDLWQKEDLKAIQEGEDPPIGACIAWGVKDDVAFRAGFEKLLKHLKGVVNRFDKRTVKGVEIFRVGSAFMTGMHMAIGKGLFAVAVGKEGVAQLEALVTTDPKKRAGDAIPAPVQKVRQFAPGGWNGVGLFDLKALFGGQIAMVLDLAQDRLPGPMRPDISVDKTQKALDQLLPLVIKHGLRHLVGMSGYQQNTWRARVIW